MSTDISVLVFAHHDGYHGLSKGHERVAWFAAAVDATSLLSRGAKTPQASPGGRDGMGKRRQAAGGLLFTHNYLSAGKGSVHYCATIPVLLIGTGLVDALLWLPACDVREGPGWWAGPGTWHLGLVSRFEKNSVRIQLGCYHSQSPSGSEYPR